MLYKSHVPHCPAESHLLSCNRAIGGPPTARPDVYVSNEDLHIGLHGLDNSGDGEQSFTSWLISVQ